LKTLRRSARWLRSRAVGGALILGYHRISDAPDDPFGLSVTPQHFAEQLEVLSREAHPLGLQDLARALAKGRVPRRTVVLTFDDGYADNLYVAKPLLERYAIPATLFVCTGYRGREFWWDELARLVGQALARGERAPPLDGLTFGMGRSEAESGVQLTLALYRRLLPLPAAERDRHLERVRRWAGAAGEPSDVPRALTEDELGQLAASELIEVGAHTVSHPLLATLDRREQEAEIKGSKRRLEAALGRPIVSFSYPNGSLCAETVQIVRGAGFACACGSHNDVAWRGSQAHELPRFWAPDMHDKGFSRWLRRWSVS
jgi:peptidoglycan/xylan/chitin deacetylase (PgdA/CDA1 family)